MSRIERPRILAIASGGGHWIQLLRLRPAFVGADLRYASVNPELAADVEGHRFYRFFDANRERKLALVLQILQIAWILLRVRPDVIVSTGASCGYVAIRIGRIFGARTLFVDSIANAERLSLSGQLACRHANLMLTQWPHLAASEGPQYRGSVL
jgi:UDP-N-acetylglucosamine:LPS N-acetylglucosamine transferase